MYFLHLSAVEKKRKEYERKESKRKDRGRCTVSPDQFPLRMKKLREETIRLSVLIGRLGQTLDCHPEALEPMKTAMKFATVAEGDEPVLAVVQSQSFVKAPTASALLGSLASFANGLDNTYLEVLVKASSVPEAIQLFEEYLKTKDPSQELVLCVDQTRKFLHDPPPSSEAAAMGCREMAVQTERESVTVGEVQEMKTDVAGVLNVPREGIIGQGVKESSVSVIFWISERLIPSVQSEYIDLNHLRFLCDEGILQIQIEDIYILTTPSAEVRSFN